jgi:hypothetical protein
MRGACIALTLRSAGVMWSVTAADGSRGAVGGAAIIAAATGTVGRARAFECVLYHCQIKRAGELPGDHLEGHFEGQNGASECQSGLASAGVS